MTLATMALYADGRTRLTHIGSWRVKETDRITGPYRAFIEAAPFFALASGGPDGFDCSPRGDAPGFVRVADEKTLLIPDRRGNNRIDTLRNIIHDPRVALLFLIPGCGETIRVNGRATISTDPALTQSFVIDGKAPRTVIVVTVDRIYYQCAKAIVRSKLWDASRHVERKSLPSASALRARRPRASSACVPTINIGVPAASAAIRRLRSAGDVPAVRHATSAPTGSASRARSRTPIRSAVRCAGANTATTTR